MPQLIRGSTVHRSRGDPCDDLDLRLLRDQTPEAAADSLNRFFDNHVEISL